MGTILLLVGIMGVSFAMDSPLTGLIALGSMAVLAGPGLARIGLYGQFLVFLGLLQIFVFAIKVSYGTVNTTLLALLPSAFVGVMIVQVVLLMARGKLHLRWTVIDLGVVVFFLLDLLQVFNPYLNILGDQQFLSVGLRGFQQRSFLGLTYMIARALIHSERRFTKVARILAYSAALSGFYALFQQLFGFVFLEALHRQAVIGDNLRIATMYASRAVGFLGSPFTFGLMSAMGMLCGLYLLLSVPLSWRERSLAIASVLVNGMGILLSGSRSTYLALIPAIAIVVVWLPWRRLLVWAWQVRKAVAVTTVALIILIVLSRDTPPLQYAIRRVATLTELPGLVLNPDETTDLNFALRLKLATETWPLIVDNPFGYGSGIFNGGSNPQGVIKVKGYATWIDNEFSSVALELGVPGLFLLLSIVAMSVWRCCRVARIPEARNRAIILMALIVVCPTAGFGGQWLAAYPANVLFWVFAGIIAGLPLSAPTEIAHTAAAGLEETPNVTLIHA
ncbi:MAG: O-antigen ligase family protein [Chloroflexi bacterium]|nr:O-antigen ligase family protein [Chloroflexota bacterium]MBU1750214.1 O-antigen ligase family protein [Chloroflexota bacterium]